MLQVVKRIWVKALTNNEYKQGRGALHSHGRYCCLGVLRKVADLGDDYANHSGALCLGQLRLVGLKSSEQRKLIRLNDGHIGTKARKHSFAEIAAWISKNL